jgi:hypothetical protein
LNGHLVRDLRQSQLRPVRTWRQADAIVAKAQLGQAPKIPAFCTACGAATFTDCPHCHAAIEGFPKPAYCGNCGKAYPWQQSIEKLQALLQESELNEEDRQEVEIALPDVMGNTPKTESAVLKVRHILGKLGKPFYEAAMKIFTDVASETAKKTLGLK